jgi:hypothetical protein
MEHYKACRLLKNSLGGNHQDTATWIDYDVTTINYQIIIYY